MRPIPPSAIKRRRPPSRFSRLLAWFVPAGRSIDDLEESMEVVEAAVIIAGLVLFVGLFGEYQNIGAEVPQVWPVVLVLIGVGGEVVGAFIHSVLAARLRLLESRKDTEHDAELARLSESTALANQRASEADARAAEANERAAQADQRAEEAHALAATAELSAAEARFSMVELESTLTPSYLFPERVPHLRAMLAKWAGHTAVVFLNPARRRDSTFAVEMRNILMDAGWTVHMEVLPDWNASADSPAGRYSNTDILVEYDQYEGCDRTVEYAAQTLAEQLKIYGYAGAEWVRRNLPPLGAGESADERREIRLVPPVPFRPSP